MEQKEATIAQTIRTVKKIVAEVSALQRKAEGLSPNEKRALTQIRIRQKKALKILGEMAKEGSAIAGAGYVKACCVCGQYTDYIFRYCDYDAQTMGAEYLKKLFEPHVLIPFLSKENAVKNVHSIMAFAQELPTLRNKPFTPQLYDALQCRNNSGETFSQQVAKRLQVAFEEASNMNGDMARFELNAIVQTIRLLAHRGYAPVQNVYGDILYSQNRLNEARTAYQSVLRNCFATQEETQVAKSKLQAMQMRSVLNTYTVSAVKQRSE